MEQTAEENKKITITDVAKRAGVSPGTVSHVINGNSYVHADTRERVMKVIEELGYVPNRSGRILKTNQTKLIMMAIPDNSNEIYFQMIRAFQNTVKKSGYSMLLYYTDGLASEELKTVQLLKERLVDGLFLVHFSYDETLRTEISKAPGPVVLCSMSNHIWSGSNNNFDTISIDVYNGIYTTVNHLIQMGHTKIGYLAGRSGIDVYHQRHQAYMDALSEHGIPYRDDYVVWNDYSTIGGYNSTRQLYQNPDRPTAICASNDQQAIGCWEALRDYGRSIPKDFALTGMDNLEISKILNITSINMKEDVVGEEAGKLLMQRLNTPGVLNDYQNVYLKPELVVRQSTLGVF